MQLLKILSSKSYSVLIHPRPNTEPPYTKHPYLAHSSTKLTFFWDVGSARWRAKNVFLVSELEEQSMKI
jgi:hypothetical protein